MTANAFFPQAILPPQQRIVKGATALLAQRFGRLLRSTSGNTGQK